MNALAKAGFQQMLEKCISANSGIAEAADMVRRASQAQQVLNASRAAGQPASVTSAEPEEAAGPQGDDDAATSLA